LLASCHRAAPEEVLIAGGTVVLGNDASYPEEQRGPPVRVGRFAIDTHEVTNAQYAQFVSATGYVTEAERGFFGRADIPKEQQQPGSAVFVMPGQGIEPGWRFMPGANWRHPEGPGSTIEGHDRDPVVQITFADAMAYAHWKGRDLPTEAEWEFAAADSDQLPGRERPLRDGKPSGNNWDGVFPRINTGADGFVGRAPVGSFPPDRRGLYDMTGNVWELTRSPWTQNHSANAPHFAGAHVIKGGSFLCADNYCARYRPQSRQEQEIELGTNHIGFRTVRRIAAASAENAAQKTALR
jgi:formylglycine-generating enzyme required for sulfatase activity